MVKIYITNKIPPLSKLLNIISIKEYLGSTYVYQGSTPSNIGYGCNDSKPIKISGFGRYLDHQ